MNRYRFQISGYIEVMADSIEQAVEQVTDKNHNVPKSYTSYMKVDDVFVYAVAIGKNPELIPN